ncbi:class I SAM-dependent methyltransferase [uncultured Propionibacterium sp.]|uniref:class I SAM-dependent methyltransferase n=1 Tax=uncultured Propionibacterium sp. TaxID=218066 RepID=UPI00292EA5C4|nr:class I SAM-dependent methyltransferase [uncultured Propionibacterium sp.]
MDIELARTLAGPAGAEAIAAAAALPDPDSLSAAEAMRAAFAPDLAAAALTQVSLRARARRKLGERADRLLWTPDSVEQATRAAVSRWRAERLRAAGITRVIDLGCGAGADSLACLDAGMEVTAVDVDPATAELAVHNLPGARVLCADATRVAAELTAGADERTCVLLDPARRTARGRSWRLEDLRPGWGFVQDMLVGPTSAVVKLGPGTPTEVLPRRNEAVWVSERGEVVECGLWRLPGGGPGRAALLLPGGILVRADPDAPALDVCPPGRFIIEPDGAVSRAGALARIGPGLWRLAARVAYLSGDEPVSGPLADCFEVLVELDARPAALRAWVRANRIGVLEIKKRALDVDPAALRRRLRPSGPNRATLILSPTIRGARAFVVRPLRAGA